MCLPTCAICLKFDGMDGMDAMPGLSMDMARRHSMDTDGLLILPIKLTYWIGHNMNTLPIMKYQAVIECLSHYEHLQLFLGYLHHHQIF